MTLPQSNFADLALDLNAACNSETQALIALETNAALYRRAGQEAGVDHDAQLRNWRVYEEAMLATARTVRATDDAHKLLKTLAEHEADIRALIAQKTGRAAA